MTTTAVLLPIQPLFACKAVSALMLASLPSRAAPQAHFYYIFYYFVKKKVYYCASCVAVTIIGFCDGFKTLFCAFIFVKSSSRTVHCQCLARF